MACENCLYRKNCQFLSKHKNVEVKDCTAFMSETEFIKKAKTEAVREFAERLKAMCDAPHWCVWLSDIDDLIEEMTEEVKE